MRPALVFIAYAVFYLILDTITAGLEGELNVSLWFPPVGLTLALLLMFGWRYAPAVAVVFLAHLILFRGGMGYPAALVVTIPVLYTALYTSAAVLLSRVVKIDPRLPGMRDVAWFVGVACFLAPLVVAAVTVWGFVLGGYVPRDAYLANVVGFWAGDATGIGVLTSFLLVALRPFTSLWAHIPGEQRVWTGFRLLERRELPEVGLQVLALVLSLVVAYGASRGSSLDYAYIAFAPVVWIALRGGFERAVAAVLLVNVGVVLLVGGESGGANPIVLQFGLMTLTLVGLLLGALATTQKRTEEALEKGEKRFRSVVDYAADAVFVHDLEGDIVDVNRRACESLGYTREELLCLSVADIEMNASSGGFLEAWRRSIPGEPFTVAGLQRRKDGSMFPVEVRVGAFPDRDGQLLVALARDVTERERAERELEESEARFKSAFEDASTGVALVGLDNRYLRINAALCKMLGYLEEEFLGRTSFEFTHPEDMDLSQGRSQQMLAEGGPQTMSLEKRYLRKDGTVVWASTDVSLVRDADGKPDHFVSQFHDITRRKNAEEDLERERNLLRTVIDSTRDAIFAKDTAHRFVLNNTFHLDALGLASQEESLGKTNADIWGEDKAAPHHADDQWVMETGESIVGREEMVPVPSGEERWFSTNKVPLRSIGSGVVEGLVALSRDITERKRFEQELSESEARFRQLFEQSVDALLVHDEQGRVVDCNPEACRSLGYSREELLGMSLSDFVVEGLLSEEELRVVPGEVTLWRSALSGEPGKVVGRARGVHRRKDGATFPVEVALSSMDYDNRRLIVAAARDITEREQAEAALRESEARFRQLFEQSVDALLVHDEEGRYVDVNAQACRLYGYSREELLSLSVSDLSRETLSEEESARKQREEGGTLWQRAMASEPGVFAFRLEEANRRKDGTTFTAEVQLGSVDYGGRRLILVAVRDITERKQAQEALSESETRFRQLFEQSVDAVVVHDVEGNVIDANQKASESLGYSREELISMKVGDYEMKLLTEEERAQKERSGGTLWQRIVANEPGTVAGLHVGEHRRKDGTTFPVEAHVGGVEYGGRRLILSSMRDITERKQAEDAVRESERRLRTVTSGAPVVLFAVDTEGVVTFEDGTALRSLGVEPGASLGRSLFEAYPHLREIHRYVRRALQGEEITATVDIDNRAYHTHYSPQVDEYGQVVGVLGVATDITDRRELEKELAFRASHDPLTGLPNRALFEERLSAALSRLEESHDAPPGQTGPAVLFMDLDNFKIVNDSLGHEAGDELLVAAAGRLRGCLRPPDTVARLGGDEFAVLLEEGGAEEAGRVAERIRARLRQPFSLRRAEVSETAEAEYMVVEASVGIATSELGAATKPAELLRRADLAMYRSKGGDEGVTVFEAWMDEQTQQRLKLERDLRRAIGRLQEPQSRPGEEEFALYYQPKVHLQTGRVVSMEALLRWEHPEKGLLPPPEFVPLAQTLGLMVPLGRWVLRTACRKAREWQDLCHTTGDQSPLLMSVNLSAQELHDPGLVDEVAAALAESGLAPGALVLEVSEEAAVADAAPAVYALRRLKELGAGLALDDFGTGYSSLSYLRDLPLDYVKIDRSLVSGMMTDESNRAIVSATISLAHALGLDVTAEGAQTAEEAAELESLGCDLGQGFYWHGLYTATQMQRFVKASTGAPDGSADDATGSQG